MASIVDAPIRSLRISELVGESGLNREFVTVFGLCSLFMFFDGWDLFGISYVAADIVRDLGLPQASIGILFMAGGISMMVGAFLFGYLGDRIGRRAVLLTCGVIFSTGSIISAMSPNFEVLLISRLVAGLGLGGVGAGASALVSEYAPKRFAGGSIIFINIALILGSITSGFFASHTPHWGWQGIFWVGGIAPFFLLVLAYFVLPESADFLLRKEGPKSARVMRQMRSIRPDLDWDGDVHLLAEPQKAKSTILGLFTGRLAILTPTIWAWMIISLIMLYFYASWLPPLLRGLGFDAKQVITIVATGQVGNLFGAIVLSKYIAGRRPFLVLASTYAVAGTLLIICSRAGGAIEYWMALGFFLGIFIGATQMAATAVSALQYPLEVRSTGLGWSIGVGRFGGIICPAIVGYLMHEGWPNADIFALASAAPFACALICLFIARYVERHPEEQA